MASYLDYLLKKTMLLSASENLKPSSSFKVPTVTALSSATQKTLNSSASAILSRSIWQYECAGLTQVKNVEVRDRTTPGDPLRLVFDSIKWGQDEGDKAHVIAVREGKDGKEQKIKLPLTKSFLLRTYFLSDGKIPGGWDAEGTSMKSARIWQLETNLCSSFQYVFGYEIETGEPKPITGPEAETRGGWMELSETYPGGSTPIRVVIPPPARVLVCLGFGCANERNDFEPGGVLGAARIYPHFMFLTTTALKRIEAEITCARPAQSKVSGLAKAHSSHSHSHSGDSSDSMNPDIEAAFYTDTNKPVYEVSPIPYITNGIASPYWDNLFDYYWTSPPAKESTTTLKESMTMVASKVTQSREYSVSKAEFKLLDIYTAPTRSSRARQGIRGGLDYTGSKSVLKLARQGEFDNVHIAPTMRMAKKILDASPWPELKRITMAPFCAHDCLHMHWRWIKNEKHPRYTFGWGGTAENPGGPFQVPGAPLVPANQDIAVKMLSATTFVYRAVINQPQPLVWQPVMHHGAAYSISAQGMLEHLLKLDDARSDDLPGQGLLDEINGQWSILYWNLRYRTLIASSAEKIYGTKSKFLDRLNLTSETLKKLREVEFLKGYV